MFKFCICTNFSKQNSAFISQSSIGLRHYYIVWCATYVHFCRSIFFMKVSAALYIKYLLRLWFFLYGWGEKLKFFMGSVSLMRVKNCQQIFLIFLYYGIVWTFFTQFVPAMPTTLTIKEASVRSILYYNIVHSTILLNDDENHFFIVISIYFLRIFLF